ncbi:MAG TPA: FAD/NAD(P)-binding oxidoreductase, partial [Mycobacteriales bacterium]|nr:FAD/NAD(P)-binding oxidoreductase [Mycobacteriales bacterium]
MGNAAGIVVVGAGLGGVRTAERLREGGYEGRITLLGAEIDPPYDRPPLSKQVLRGERPIVHLRAPDSYADAGLDLRLGATAVALDAEHHCVELADGATVAFDQLVIATGARPRALPGADALPGVHVLRTARDCERIRKDVASAGAAVVVGGGFIGCEVAASLRQLGLDVTLLEMATAPLAPVLGDQVASYVTALHRDAGVHVRGGARVDGIEGDEHVTAVRLAVGSVLPADIVVVGLGVTPEVDWLVGSGLEIDHGIRCDSYGTTSAPDVFALGDVASYQHAVTGVHHRFEHWTSAVDQAAVVAHNLLAEPQSRREHTAVPYFWSDQHKVKIQSL